MVALVITQNITLDGVIEAVDDWFNPRGDDPADAAILKVTRENMARESAFLVGHQTFVSLRDFWSGRTDDTTGITEHLNGVDKYVLSRTLGDPQWDRTVVLGRDITRDVTRVKQAQSGNVGVTGSISVCHQLISHHLVDEYRLFVYPRVLGRGRRLFPEGVDVPLTLVDSQPFANGVVLMTYRPA